MVNRTQFEHFAIREPSHQLVQKNTIAGVDKFLTMSAAAVTLGLPYHTVQRAARRGLIPVYSIGNTRRYVKISDILALSTSAVE